MMQAANFNKSHQLAYQSPLRNCDICANITPENVGKLTMDELRGLHDKHFELMTPAQIDAAEQNQI